METHLVGKTLVFNSRQQLLILKRSTSDAHRPGGFDVPGGKIDDGEPILDGAIREALEEAGLVLDASAMRLVYTNAGVGFNASYGRTLNLGRLQFATLVSEQEVTLSDEHDSYEWLTIDEVIARTNHPFQKMVLQYIKDNEIVKELWSTP